MPEKREHVEQTGGVRHTAEAANIDFIVYKSWKCSMTRERPVTRRFLLWTWTGWERDGRALNFVPEWQDGAGRLVTVPPAMTTETGYRSAEHLLVSVPGPFDDNEISRIESMRMTYTFEDKEYELVEGKNWVTFTIAIIAMILLVVAFGGLGLLAL